MMKAKGEKVANSTPPDDRYFLVKGPVALHTPRTVRAALRI